MIKKMTAALAAVAAAAGLVVTVAHASTPKSHHIHQTGEGGGIGHPPFTGPGAPGSVSTFAGTLGTNGAIIEKWAFKAGSSSTFGGTVTVFEPQGSYSGKITSGILTGAGGSGPPQGATLKVKITAGSGLYKAATGTATITHALISGSPAYYTIVVSGSIKY
jgi:hypothetical protein